MSMRLTFLPVLLVLPLIACGKPSAEPQRSEASPAGPPLAHALPDMGSAEISGDTAVEAENPIVTALAAARERHDFVWLGLSEAEAQAQAEAKAVPWRVVRRDGADLPATRDHRPGRVSAHIVEGLVLAVLIEGEGGGPSPYEGVILPELLPFIGLSEAESEAAARESHRPWRLVSRDGEQFMVTMDYIEERVNAIVRDGVVVAANNG
ncbi:MAG: hypothetical protein EA402_02770 [Planctomycetota bacterium]|nr:MAG: hypothetical protein EA402_02770 [Planctomycetota bacterium]